MSTLRGRYRSSSPTASFNSSCCRPSNRLQTTTLCCPRILLKSICQQASKSVSTPQPPASPTSTSRAARVESRRSSTRPCSKAVPASKELCGERAWPRISDKSRPSQNSLARAVSSLSRRSLAHSARSAYWRGANSMEPPRERES